MKICTILSATVACGMAFSAVAGDGSITFNGNILDTACTVSTPYVNQTVNLGSVAKSALGGVVGTTASSNRFELVLANCGAALQKVSARFTGTASSEDKDILALNNGSDSASGVGVALFESDGVTPVKLGTESIKVPLVSNGTTSGATLTYFARYKVTKTPVTSGKANTSAEFTLTYE